MHSTIAVSINIFNMHGPWSHGIGSKMLEWKHMFEFDEYFLEVAVFGYLNIETHVFVVF